MTTIPESHRDLLDAQFATLGTIDGDGLPQLTEVWFLSREDGAIQVTVEPTKVHAVDMSG